ncbi:MAG: transposase [Bacteroidetes bacterium]|jgi:putative transposase|nr:transposase [Bacteroidota bacterium]MBK7567076.1 transposase [Bacteroidota bacterium]MBP8916590.1 transposase [Chitinophagales bacterium]MBP9190817.1 transposase [Chitinophagales bacterium]MBP9796519.1 transposase [Chitinophagales bacterium]
MPFYNPFLQEYTIPLFFSTSTILNWKPLLAKDGNKNIIISSWRHLVETKRINMYGFVIMPTHIHSIFSICENQLMKDVQRDFGKFTAKQLILKIHLDETLFIEEYKSTQKDRKYQIWERRPLAIPIYNDKTFYQKLNYIHCNPCSAKWNLANTPQEYLYSSAKFYETGIDDWGFLTSM